MLDSRNVPFLTKSAKLLARISHVKRLVNKPVSSYLPFAIAYYMIKWLKLGLLHTELGNLLNNAWVENRKSFVQIQHCKRLYHFCYFSFISTFILGMQLRTSIKYQLIFYYPCISNCAFFYYICPFLFSCLSNPRKIKTTTRRFTFQNHLINLIYKVHQLCRYLNGALQNW